MRGNEAKRELMNTMNMFRVVVLPREVVKGLGPSIIHLRYNVV